jgi:hypothetical protein
MSLLSRLNARGPSVAKGRREEPPTDPSRIEPRPATYIPEWVRKARAGQLPAKVTYP